MERSHSIFMEKSFNVWLWMAGAFAVLCLIGSAVRAESLGTVQVIGSAETENVKKIALTFDDDVIIGLSQEISYKEAVSMI